MKKISGLLFLLWISAAAGQNYSLDVNYFYGSIVEHNKNISHLITDRPHGIMLGFNRKTYGHDKWEAFYNYPDVGYTILWQDMKNPHLGNNFSAYGHLGLYFLDRRFQLKVGQGLAVTTNPYHPVKNHRNTAYGSRLMSSTFFSGNFQWENIWRGFGLHAGVSLIHYSNADFKSPNNSTNTIAANVGLNYLFRHREPIEFIPASVEDLSEPIHYNFVVRSGVNTIGIIGSKAYPFLTFSAYADKRFNGRSTLQAGAEFFLSRAMEEFIHYQVITFPAGNTSGYEDPRRAGAFLGHQLTFNNWSLITHVGYYFYYPYHGFSEQVYLRVGLQRSLYKNIFASATLRAHRNNAEAVEFSLGYRL